MLFCSLLDKRDSITKKLSLGVRIWYYTEDCQLSHWVDKCRSKQMTVRMSFSCTAANPQIPMSFFACSLGFNWNADCQRRNCGSGSGWKRKILTFLKWKWIRKPHLKTNFCTASKFCHRHMYCKKFYQQQRCCFRIHKKEKSDPDTYTVKKHMVPQPWPQLQIF